MKFLDYLGITEIELQTYIDGGLVDVAHHDEFPLEMYTYGRKATYENVWDNVTTKCRGIIVNAETDEIVARPFEKFFNLNTAGRDDTCSQFLLNLGAPIVYEKMDGFLCTMYEWKGRQYVASKGSFHSIHAKWATAWYQKNVKGQFPVGYTPVFEGICPSLRIVVDYDKREELVLLALIAKETGAELNIYSTDVWARNAGVSRPRVFGMTLGEAQIGSYDKEVKNFEGYVLLWPQWEKPAIRVKVKYVDYLRIHRMVTGTSAKAIFEVLSGNSWKADMNELLNESTPWFNKFVLKWKDYLEGQFKVRSDFTQAAYHEVKTKALDAALTGEIWTRKQWATEFQQFPEMLWSSLFAMLDGKELAPVIWKQIKPLTKNAKPLVDARFV